MTDRGTVHRVTAGPYTLALPINGIAILYDEDGKRLPGGVGYLGALVQFAGEVIRLNAEIVALREKHVEVVEFDLVRHARDKALEEAAAACLHQARDYVIPIGQDNYHDGCVSCAAAIRALKESRDT